MSLVSFAVAGRNLTLSYSVPIGSNLVFYNSCLVAGPGAADPPFAFASGIIKAFVAEGISTELTWTGNSQLPNGYSGYPFPFEPGHTGETFFGFGVTAATGLGSTGSNNFEEYVAVPGYPGFPTGPWGATIGIAGTATITLDTELVCEVDYDPTNDSDGFPSNGDSDAPVHDGLPGQVVRFYRRALIGGNLTATITINGVTATATDTITSSNQFAVIDKALYSEPYCIASGTQAAYSSMRGATLNGDAIDENFTWSDAMHACDTVSGAYASAAETSPYNHGLQQAEVQAYIAPDTVYSIGGRLRAMDQPFLGSLPVRVADAAGHISTITGNAAFTDTVTQKDYQIAALFNGSGFGSATLNQIAPVKMWIQTSTMAPDDPTDWRCQFRGMPYPFGTLTQAASTVVCSGGAVTSPAGSLTPTATVWEGYRYLQFTADQPGTLTLGAKNWNWSVVTPGTSQTVTLDLCSPSGWTNNGGALLAYDGRDSRHPLSSPSTGPLGTAPDETTPDDHHKGQMWGVFDVSTLAFSGIPSGQTLHLGALSLVRQSYANVSFLPTFLTESPQLGWTDSSSNSYYVSPFALLNSDGHWADYPGMWHVLPADGFAYPTLSALGGFLSAAPGWTFTVAGSFPADGWHNASGYGLWAGGSGAWHQGGNWTDSLALDATGSLVLWAQPLYDSVQVPANEGDVWESSVLTGSTPLYMTKILRSAARGVCFNSSSGAALPGAGVSVYETGSIGVLGGAGTSGSDGTYQTGSPGGYSDVDWTTAFSASGTSLTDHRVWSARHWYRDSFRQMALAFVVDYDVSLFLMHARALINTTSGDLYIGTSSNATPTIWTDVNTGLAPQFSAIRWQDGGSQAPIGLFYCLGSTGSLLFAQTYNSGASFTTPMTIATVPGGKTLWSLDFEECPDGLRKFYWLLSDGTIYGSVLDRSLNVVKAGAATNLTGISQGDIRARASITPNGGQTRIGLMFLMSGSLNVEFSADNYTFS